MKAKTREENMKKVMRTGLFNPEALESLRASGFTGRLRMSWSEGNIDDFRLTSSVSFSRHDKRHGRVIFDLDDDDDD